MHFSYDAGMKKNPTEMVEITATVIAHKLFVGGVPFKHKKTTATDY